MDTNTPICVACAAGRVEVVKALIESQRVNLSEEHNIALMYAIVRGRSKVVKLLLETGVDASAENNTAIFLASAGGHVEIVELLLQHQDVNPSAQDNSAICCASQHGHWKIVQHLIDHRADPSANNNYPMRVALRRDHKQVIDVLSKSGGGGGGSYCDVVDNDFFLFQSLLEAKESVWYCDKSW